LITLLNELRYGFTHIVNMTETVTLFDLSHVGCQPMIVERITDPAREVSSARVSI
jgi:hypothetical protein